MNPDSAVLRVIVKQEQQIIERDAALAELSDDIEALRAENDTLRAQLAGIDTDHDPRASVH